ncbi:MAG TPA: TIGR03986 family CRISPR-associated RAMP protein [Candidatus Syntrophosphaera thermopropionivorans]|nr:TIGR03986 family CRISPR-associated RAMP protein [Candidatus Syntrophosphaera thermopropionivorans]
MTKATLYVSRSKKGAVVLDIQPENAGKRSLPDSVFREDEKIKSLEPGEYEVEIELEENTKKIVALSIDDHTIRLPEFKPVPKYQPKQEKSQLKETTTSPEQAYAPYNFVSLDDIVIFYNKDALPRRNSFTGLSGRINLNIETKTPLYIQRTLTEKEVEELTKIEKEENNKEKIRDFNRKIYQSFSPASGKYKIPGSSLRGMVRSLYEIATYSKMSFLDDRKLYFRAFADRAKLLQEYYNKRMINEDKNAIPRLKVKAGYLFKSGKDFYINEAENYYRVEEDKVLNEDFIKLPFSKKGNDEKSKYDDYITANPYLKIGYSKKNHIVRNGFIIINNIMPYNEVLPEDYQEGYIVFSKGIPLSSKTKRKYWVVGKKTDKKHKIDETVVNDYYNDKNRNSINLIDYLNKNKKEYTNGIPCFFLYEDGQVTAFGNTALFRISYKNSIGKLLPENHKSDELDMAEALFGRVMKKQEDTINGRIYFDDAVAKEAVAFEKPIYPKILANPKPTSFQLYLKQPSDVTFDTIRHYDSPDAKLRGYKQYWHKKSENFEEDSPDFDPQKDTQHTLIAPIKPGAKFQGSIRFENLSEEELGALLFVLNLPEGYCHKIGMGKPLGLGSIKITATLNILDPKKRYSNLTDNGYTNDDPSKYLDAYKELLKKHHILNTENPWDLMRFRELKKMLDFANHPDESKTEYMPLDQFRERGVLPEPLKV